MSEKYDELEFSLELLNKLPRKLHITAAIISLFPGLTTFKSVLAESDYSKFTLNGKSKRKAIRSCTAGNWLATIAEESGPTAKDRIADWGV